MNFLPWIVLAVGLQAQTATQTRQPPAPPALPQPAYAVTVIETAPLPGVDLPLGKIPAPVQTATERRHRAEWRARSRRFPEPAVERRAFVNEVQSNPFQPDINYRGYTASPLLGTPQGLSVYMDGVRLNQPFGDVVSWDLIPRLADLHDHADAGVEPAVRSQHAGRGLSIQTKTATAPGHHVQAIYGSDERRSIEFEHGGQKANGLNWYVAGNLFGEDGWRDDSPSDVRQVFGKDRLAAPEHDVALPPDTPTTRSTATAFRSRQFLERDYASVYTKPDTTDNRSTFFNVTARRHLNARISLSGNAYYRDIRTTRSTAISTRIRSIRRSTSRVRPNGPHSRPPDITGFPASGADATNTPFPSGAASAMSC